MLFFNGLPLHELPVIHAKLELVTIREEDFNRARISAYNLHYSPVELTFGESDARLIYASLAEAGHSSKFLTFEEAWERFGGGGPLLEFVHLVTQGTTLRERLTLQITKLLDEVRTGLLTTKELDLLRMSCVASAFGGRLKLADTVQQLGLPAPSRTIELFEKEYLIRRTDGGATIEGLHAVRSEIIVELLTDGALHPWARVAERCLPLLDESSLEVFLLHTFQERVQDTPAILAIIDNLNFQSWKGLNACRRALTWLGVSKYISANKDLLADTAKTFGAGWMLVIDCDIAEALPKSSENSFGLMQSLLSAEKFEEFKSFRARQTPKRDVFEHVKTWLSSRQLAPKPPNGNDEWLALAESGVWLAKLECNGPLVEAFKSLELVPLMTELQLEVAAEVIGATAAFSPANWESARQHLIDRFRKATGVPVMEDDGTRVRAHFIIRYDGSSWGGSSDYRLTRDGSTLHSEAMYRVYLLRRIWPDREVYACSGYGFGGLGLVDETVKEISAAQVPDPWLTIVNSTFLGLVTYGFRPDSWIEHQNQTMAVRRALVSICQEVLKRLLEYFRSPVTVPVDDVVADLEACKAALSAEFLLPKVAVDPWGLTSELQDSVDDSSYELPVFVPALSRYKDWLKAYRDFINPASNFVSQAPVALLLQPLIGRSHPAQHHALRLKAEELGLDLKLINLSLHNLSRTVASILQMQVAFRNMFWSKVNDAELTDFERVEQSSWDALWRAWVLFVHQPANRWDDPGQGINRAMSNIEASCWRQVDKRLRKLRNKGLYVTYLTCTQSSKGATRWYAADSDSSIVFLTAGPMVYQAIRESTPSTELAQSVQRYTCSSVGVIPLVRGRSLDRRCWRADLLITQSSSFIETPIQWQVKDDVTADEWDRLNLAEWPSHLTRAPMEFLKSYAHLDQLLRHLSDIARIDGELDDVGRSLTDLYLQDVAAEISRLLNTGIIGQFGSHLADVTNSITPSTAASAKLVLDSMLNCVRQLDPGTSEDNPYLSLSELRAWHTRLTERTTEFLRLFAVWADYVIMEAGYLAGDVKQS